MQHLRDLAERAVDGSEADLAEITVLASERSLVMQSGIMAENHGPVGRLTGIARAFVSNRWGLCEFDDMDGMRAALDTAAARAIHGSSPPVPFPMLSEEHRDTYDDCTGALSPVDVSLREKAFLCRHYCELLGASAGSGSARVSYEQSRTDRITVNSRGTSLREIETLGSMRMEAVLPGGRVFMSETASRGSFEPFRGLEKKIEEAGKNLMITETSTVIAPGKSRVVLAPELTGILVHEAFGHLAEADFLEANPAVAHMMRPGARIGSSRVSIVDDGGLLSMPGSMKWDYEGNPGARTVLVSEGVMGSWLHTGGTASRNGAEPTGNARIAEPGRPPEARMTCTYMEPGIPNLEELLKMLGNGLYLRGFMGGATDMDRFSIAVQEAWTVRGGEIHKPVAPVVISGRVTDFLTSVEETGNDLAITGALRGCSRRGTNPVPVSYGGPHILIDGVQVT